MVRNIQYWICECRFMVSHDHFWARFQALDDQK